MDFNPSDQTTKDRTEDTDEFELLALLYSVTLLKYNLYTILTKVITHPSKSLNSCFPVTSTG